MSKTTEIIKRIYVEAFDCEYDAGACTELRETVFNIVKAFHSLWWDLYTERLEYDSMNLVAVLNFLLQIRDKCDVYFKDITREQQRFILCAAVTIVYSCNHLEMCDITFGEISKRLKLNAKLFSRTIWELVLNFHSELHTCLTTTTINL
jgi:hypothetical protein